MREPLPFTPEDKNTFPGLPEGMLAETAPPEETGTALVHVSPSTDSRMAKLYEEALAILQDAEALEVRGGPDLQTATNNLVMIKGLKNALEEARDGYVRPLNDFVKDINAAFRIFTEPLNQADTRTQGKVLAYHKEQDRIQLAQEEINRKREEAAREEMALAGELSESVGLIEVQAPVPSRHLTNMGAAGLTSNWKWEVAKIEDVPKEYLMIDAAKVGKVVRAGLHSIPGFRIWDEKGLRVTGAKS